MFFSDFLYIIKRVLVSPSVIFIIIAALLYLELVLYIMNYSKNKNKSVRKSRKEKYNKSNAKQENTETDSEESEETEE